MGKFYMVFNTTTRGPTKEMHKELHQAQLEARRLARTTPGHRFVVLEAILAYQMFDIREEHLS